MHSKFWYEDDEIKFVGLAAPPETIAATITQMLQSEKKKDRIAALNNGGTLAIGGDGKATLDAFKRILPQMSTLLKSDALMKAVKSATLMKDDWPVKTLMTHPLRFLLTRGHSSLFMLTCAHC